MNVGLFDPDGLPTDACLHPQDANGIVKSGVGYDRITKTTYLKTGQVATIVKAAGAPLQQTYATYEYTANGKQKTVTDALGAKTEMVYDGFDRLSSRGIPTR